MYESNGWRNHCKVEGEPSQRFSSSFNVDLQLWNLLGFMDLQAYKYRYIV